MRLSKRCTSNGPRSTQNEVFFKVGNGDLEWIEDGDGVAKRLRVRRVTRVVMRSMMVEPTAVKDV